MNSSFQRPSTTFLGLARGPPVPEDMDEFRSKKSGDFSLFSENILEMDGFGGFGSGNLDLEFRALSFEIQPHLENIRYHTRTMTLNSNKSK